MKSRIAEILGRRHAGAKHPHDSGHEYRRGRDAIYDIDQHQLSLCRKLEITPEKQKFRKQRGKQRNHTNEMQVLDEYCHQGRTRTNCRRDSLAATRNATGCSATLS